VPDEPPDGRNATTASTPTAATATVSAAIYTRCRLTKPCPTYFPIRSVGISPATYTEM
jgi:hypothetical protein